MWGIAGCPSLTLSRFGNTGHKLLPRNQTRWDLGCLHLPQPWSLETPLFQQVPSFFFLLIFLISFFSPFFFSIKQAQAYRVCLAGLRHVLWLLRAVDFSPQHFPSVCPQSIPVALPSSHPTLGMVQDCSRQIQLTEQLLGFFFFGFFLEKGS